MNVFFIFFVDISTEGEEMVSNLRRTACIVSSLLLCPIRKRPSHRRERDRQRGTEREKERERKGAGAVLLQSNEISREGRGRWLLR